VSYFEIITAVETNSRRLPLFLAFAALAAAMFAYLRPWTFDGALNDDWAYLLPAHRLASMGRLRLTDWGSGTQIAQIFWGAFWTKIFGWSPGILRCLTLLLAFASGFVLSLLLEGSVASAAARLLAGLALILNPIALPLSVSFMTDIPYMTLMLGSLLAYRSALADDRDLPWLAASSLAAAAYLVRQTGILIPLAPTALLLVGKRLTLPRAAKTWAIPVAAALGHAAWFHWAHGPTWASQNYVWAATLARMARPGAFLSEGIWRAYCLLAYAGLFCLPGGLALKAGRRSGLAWGAAAFFVASGLVVWHRAGSFPYLENLFAPATVGGLTLGGASFKPSGFLAARLFWTATTILSIAGGALLLRALAETAENGIRERGASLLIVCSLLQALASLLGAKYFDRYILFLLPGALALAFRGPWGKLRLAAGWAVLAATAAVSILGTADYLAWNKAKWRLGLAAVGAGLKPPMIIAGFDWGGYWGYEPAMEILKKTKPLDRIGEWEWQTVFPAVAIMSWKPPERVPWRPVAEEHYSTPLSSRRGTIYLYKAGGQAPTFNSRASR
jgi:hypothetical protein